ncbi:MAG: transporter substrate-binding domain-containing protein [Desulfobulbaceae bacterium]|nr:transporter substrate-binding domain-containing protein [Desulfobulbaceae bacterium]
MTRPLFYSIPGLTEDEIKAVEKALAKNKSLIYGAIKGSECFYQPDGSMAGFTVQFAKWMSRLFGVPVEVKIYSWQDLVSGIKSGDIDFTGDLSLTSAEARGFVMTRPFMERPVQFITRAFGKPLDQIAGYSALTVAFLRDSSVRPLALPHLLTKYGDKLKVVDIDSLAEGADKLRQANIDMVVSDSAWLKNFAGVSDIAVNVFHPLLHKRMTLTSGRLELAPLVTAVNKSFSTETFNQLYSLHRQESEAFYRHIFINSLSEDERTYYEEYIKNDIPIPVAANPTNYPIEFYDETDKRWDGLAFDILAKISKITGLTFKPVKFDAGNWSLSLKTIQSGDSDTPMLLNMAYNDSRRRDFLLADQPYLTEHYALISLNNLPNLEPDQVLFHRIGLLRDSIYTEVFNRWFPSHINMMLFDQQIDGLNAMEKGKVDLVMFSQFEFSYITDFLQKTNCKINMTFEDPIAIGFGFNKNQLELRGIISKAQKLIDTQSILRRWEYSPSNFRGKEFHTRVAILTSFCIFMLLIIPLLLLYVKRRRSESKRLKSLVDQRTEALAEQVEATKQASETKSRFLANMSHEMRTPLNAIVGLSDVMLDRGEDEILDNKNINDNIETIHNAGINLLALVNDLLDISKIEAGKITLALAEYDTVSLIADVAAMSIIRCGDKSIDFKLTIDETLPRRFRGDEVRVRQIFGNLLSNAFKYTAGGQVEWRVSWQRDGDSVWLISSVRDTGIGIPPENLDQIFSEYNRLNDSSRRHIEGTGLGLPITLNLTKMMGGELTVTSEINQGSVFSVRFRQGFVNDQAIGPEQARELQQFHHVNRKKSDDKRKIYPKLTYARVLVVDDVPANFDVAKGVMKPYRMRVDCLTGGRQAIEAVRAETVHYDAIFMDHMMPGIDGIEALRQIRAIGTPYALAVPVIALTANAIMGNEQRFLDAGFQAFLSKPIEMKRLNMVIERFVRDKSRESEVKTSATLSRAELLRQASIPGLDMEEALRRFSDDADSYWQVLQSYVDNSVILLEKIRDTEISIDEYVIAVHGLKGSSLGISALSISEKTAELEAAGRGGDSDFIDAHNGELLAMTEQLLMDLSDLLARDTAGEADKPPKDAPDAATLARLQAACRAYDMDGIDAAMTELSTYRYQRHQELILQLRQWMRAMELEKMAEGLARFEKNSCEEK